MRITNSKVYSLILFLFFFVSCDRHSFKIEGDIQNIGESKAYLIHYSPIQDRYIVLDSSHISGGHFQFLGKVDYPIACQIKIDNRVTINLLLENSEIKIKGSARIPEEISVKGSRSYDEFFSLVNKGQEMQQEKNDLWVSLINKKNNDRRHIYEEKISSIDDSLLSETRKYVEKHKKSVGASYYVFYLYVDRQVDILKLKPIIETFDKSIAKSEYVQYLKNELILGQSNLVQNSVAPDFSIKSLDGTQITLDSYKGKYLYLDFTATWCPGERQRTINKTTIYNKYGSDNFDILTIYLEKNRLGINKLEQDSIFPVWRQATDYLYWESPISKYYGIKKIPYGYLVDPRGRIIKNNPSITFLKDTLAIIFAGKDSIVGPINNQ